VSLVKHDFEYCYKCVVFSTDKGKRHIIGLRADQTRVNGQTVSVDVQEQEKEHEREGIVPEHRRVSTGERLRPICTLAIAFSFYHSEPQSIKAYDFITMSLQDHR